MSKNHIQLDKAKPYLPSGRVGSTVTKRYATPKGLYSSDEAVNYTRHQRLLPEEGIFESFHLLPLVNSLAMLTSFFGFFETTVCYAAQASLRFTAVLLYQPPECWGRRCLPLFDPRLTLFLFFNFLL